MKNKESKISINWYWKKSKSNKKKNKKLNKLNKVL